MAHIQSVNLRLQWRCLNLQASSPSPPSSGHLPPPYNTPLHPSDSLTTIIRLYSSFLALLSFLSSLPILRQKHATLKISFRSIAVGEAGEGDKSDKPVVNFAHVDRIALSLSSCLVVFAPALAVSADVLFLFIWFFCFVVCILFVV